MGCGASRRVVALRNSSASVRPRGADRSVEPLQPGSLTLSSPRQIRACQSQSTLCTKKRWP